MYRLLVVLLLAAPAAFAQPGEAMSEEAAVLAVVHELFDAARAGDSTRARTVLHPEVRGHTVGVEEGRVVLTHGGPQPFLDAIGTPRDDAFDERVSNEEVRVDGPLATYYADYAFWRGETLSHCGVNAYQLVKTDDAGWQIFVHSDTYRACE